MTTIKHKFETTLALLEKANACSDGLETLKNSLPSDYPKNKAINLLHILKSNGIIHFFWAFRALKKDSKVTRRLIFHDILKLLQPIYDKQYSNSNVFSTILKALKTGKGLKEAAADAVDAGYVVNAAASYNLSTAINPAYNAYSAAVHVAKAAAKAAYNAYSAAVHVAKAAASYYAAAYTAYSAAVHVAKAAAKAASAAAVNPAYNAYNAYNVYNAYSAADSAANAYNAYSAAAYTDAADAVDAAANAIVDSVNYVNSATYANIYNDAYIVAANAAFDMKVKKRFDDKVVTIIKKYLE